MSELLRPRALLVDQDGTLVDSEPIWEEVEYRLTEELGGELTGELRDSFIGGPIDHTAQAIKELTGTDMDRADIAMRIIEGVATTIEREGVLWLPGVEDFLRRMHDYGLPIAVVTASVHRISDAVMADCPVDAINFMVAGDDVVNVKPAPDAYLQAAQRFNAHPSECVAIEDSRPGMTAAYTAGVRTIVVPGHQRLELPPGVSRVSSIRDITPELLHRVMSGQTFDLLA